MSDLLPECSILTSANLRSAWSQAAAESVAQLKLRLSILYRAPVVCDLFGNYFSMPLCQDKQPPPLNGLPSFESIKSSICLGALAQVKPCLRTGACTLRLGKFPMSRLRAYRNGSIDIFLAPHPVFFDLVCRRKNCSYHSHFCFAHRLWLALQCVFRPSQRVRNDPH